MVCHFSRQWTASVGNVAESQKSTGWATYLGRGSYTCVWVGVWRRTLLLGDHIVSRLLIKEKYRAGSGILNTHFPSYAVHAFHIPFTFALFQKNIRTEAMERALINDWLTMFGAGTNKGKY